MTRPRKLAGNPALSGASTGILEMIGLVVGLARSCRHMTTLSHVFCGDNETSNLSISQDLAEFCAMTPGLRQITSSFGHRR